MNAIVCLLFVAAVAQGVPVPEVQPIHHPMALTDTAKTLQSTAHMAIVDMCSPLQTALYNLETKWLDVVKTASIKKVTIPTFVKPKVGFEEIFACEAKSHPKYSAALTYLMSKEQEIDDHVQNATLIAHGLHFVSQLILDNKITSKIMESATTKLAEFMDEYSKVLMGVKSAVCVEKKPMVMEKPKPKPTNTVESPLAVFGENFMETENPHVVSSAAGSDESNEIDRIAGSDSDEANLIGRTAVSKAEHLITKRLTDDPMKLIGGK